MKRLKNSVKAIIISVCALIVVAVGVFGAVLLNKDKGGNGNDKKKYVLTSAQIELVNAINAENKKNAESETKLLPYDSSAFVDKNGFAIDQSKITSVGETYVEVSNTSDSASLYRFATKADGTTYLVDLFAMLKEKELISDTARNFSVSETFGDYFFFSYEYNDNESVKFNLDACYVADPTFASANSLVVVNSFTFDYDADEETIMLDGYNIQSCFVSANEENYVISLYLAGDQEFYETIFVNYTTSLVQSSDIIRIRYNAGYSLLAYNTESYSVVCDNKILKFNINNSSDYETVATFDSDCLYNSIYTNGNDAVLISVNSRTNERKVFHFSLENNELEEIYFENGYEYISVNTELKNYVCIFVKNSSDKIQAVYFDKNLNKVIQYDAKDTSDLIVHSDGKYILTNSGKLISTKNSVDSFVHDDCDENETIYDSYLKNKNFYVSFNSGYKIYSLSGVEIFQTTFDNFYYIDEQYALAGFDEEESVTLVRIDLKNLTYETIENTDYEKSTLEIGGVRFVNNGYVVVKVGTKYKIQSVSGEICSVDKNGETFELNNISSIEKLKTGRVEILKIELSESVLNYFGLGNIESTDIDDESETETYGYTTYTPSGSHIKLEAIYNTNKKNRINGYRATCDIGYYPKSVWIRGEHGTDIIIEATFEKDGNSIKTSSYKAWYSGGTLSTDASANVTIKIQSEHVVVEILDSQQNSTGNYIGDMNDNDSYWGSDLRPRASSAELEAYVAVYRSNQNKTTYDYASYWYYTNNTTKTIKYSNNSGTSISTSGTTYAMKGSDFSGFSSVYPNSQTSATMKTQSASYNTSFTITRTQSVSYLYHYVSGSGYKLFWTYYTYAIYKPHTYSVSVKYDAPLRKNTSVTTSYSVQSIPQTELYDKDSSGNIDKTKSRMTVTTRFSNVTKDYYSYQSDSNYQITGFNESNEPKLTNYEFAGWVVENSTLFNDNNYPGRKYSTTITTGPISTDTLKTRLESGKLSYNTGDTVNIYPVFTYADVNVVINLAYRSETYTYYGLTYSDSKYEFKLLNSTNKTLSVSLKSGSGFSVINASGSSSYTKTQTFTVEYSPNRSISEFLDYNKHGLGNSYSNAINKSKYSFTNIQYTLNRSEDWVITTSDNSFGSGGRWGKGANLTAYFTKPNVNMSKYFDSHDISTKTITFYAVYSPRKYIIGADTNTIWGSLSDSSKYGTTNYSSASLINYTNAQCEFEVGPVKKSGSSYVTNSETVLYMGSVTYKVRLKSSSITKYKLSEIKLLRYGYWNGSSYQNTTVTIKIDIKSGEINVESASGTVNRSGDYYYIGSEQINKFKITSNVTDGGTTYNQYSYILLNFEKLSAPGIWDDNIELTNGTNFKTDNNNGEIVFTIQPHAVTNSPDNDTVSASGSCTNLSEYFIVPIVSDVDGKCIYLDNTRYSFTGTEQGVYYKSGESFYKSSNKTPSTNQVYFDGSYVYARRGDYLTNYKDTRLIAIRPNQSVSKYSENPSDYSITGTGSESYELEAYLSSIVFTPTKVGAQNYYIISFDPVYRTTNSSSNSEYYKYENVYNLSGAPGNIKKIDDGTTKFEKIYYLGNTYNIHGYWYNTLSHYNGNRTFVLYLTREASTGEFMYFMFSESSNDKIKAGGEYTNDFTIEFYFSDYAMDKTISVTNTHADNDKFSSSDTTFYYRFGKGNGNSISYGINKLTAVNSTATKSVFDSYYYTNNNSYQFNPTDFIVLELQAGDGYLITSVSVTLKGKNKNGGKVDAVIMNEQLDYEKVRALYTDEHYTFSTTVGTTITSQLGFNSLSKYKPFISSSQSSKNNGISISDKINYAWKDQDGYKGSFGSLYIMIAGIYDDVEISVKTESYVEFTFYDSGNQLSSKTTPTTFADYNKLQLLVKVGSEWKNLCGTGCYNPGTCYAYKSGNDVSFTFFGCASAFNSGVKISATGQDYSSYFYDSKMYFENGNYTFSYLSNLRNSQSNTTGKYQFLGRNKNGTTLFSGDKTLTSYIGESGSCQTASNDSWLTYFEISNIKDISLYSGRNKNGNTSLFNMLQNWNSQKYEFNMKYQFYFAVKKNQIEAQVNSYIFNDSLKVDDLKTNEKLYTFKNGAQSVSTDKNSYTSDHAIVQKNMNNSNRNYQLDYVGALKSGDYRLKSDSWFNDVILTNITYQYDSTSTSKNWQNISNYKYDYYTDNYGADGVVINNTNLGGNSQYISGYYLTFTYSNIPGYYLQYIEIDTVDFGVCYITVPSYASSQSYSRVYKAFSRENFDLGLSYMLSYDSEDGIYTFKLFDDGTSSGNSGILANINSLGVMSNNIRVNFYSNAYSYTVNYHSNASGSSSNSTLTYYDNANNITQKNTSNEDDFTYTQNIYYDSMTNLAYRLEMTGYTFVGWGSQMYDDGHSRYDSTNKIWNSSSSWFRVTNYFKASNRNSLLKLFDDSDNGSYDFYVKSKTNPTMSGYFITDTGYSGAIASADRSKYNSYDYSSRIENYNFWVTYSSYFIKTMTGTQLDSNYVANNYKIDLYGVWKANVYSLKFNTNDKAYSNGSTSASLNIISSATGSDYSGRLTTHSNYNDSFITTTYAGFNLSEKKVDNLDVSGDYYCYVTFDKNDWFISKSKQDTTKILTQYDSYYSYQKYDYGVVANFNGTNYLNMILDRYGYSWLGWFSKKKDNLKQGVSTNSSSSANKIFASYYANSQYYWSDVSGKVPDLNLTAYNSFETKQEAFSEFIYHGQDVLNSSLKKNANTYYVSHYYYGDGHTQTSLTNLTKTVSGHTYFVAKDYLNVFEGSQYIDASLRKTVLTYFDTSLVYSDYDVQNANKGNNEVSVKVDRANLPATDRSLTLYAYWEVNSYQILIDWQDNDKNSFNSHGSSTAGIYRDDTLFNEIGVKSSSDAGTFVKVTLNDVYFDDESLSERLNKFNPIRTGYDFKGWSFYYYDETGNYIAGDKNKTNSPSVIQKTYERGGKSYNYETTNWLRNELTYTVGGNSRIPIFQGFTDGLSGGAEEISKRYERLNSGCFESFGDSKADHQIYIFALWQEQTFNVNVSLNISKENLENLTEKDSNFAVALYDASRQNFTGISSGYYKVSNTTYNEIVANLSFVLTFDAKLADAYVEVKINDDGAVKKFYLRDLFAVSTGYYLIDWLYDSDDKNAILVANTLQTAFGTGLNSNSCDNKNKSGSSELADSDAVFDCDFYNKVWVTNHNKNINASSYQEGNKTKLNAIDGIGKSSNFGYVTIGGKKYYISCEDVVSGDDNSVVTHYPYFRYNGSKYYVLFYYTVGATNYQLVSDHENLYYTDNNDIKYLVRFASDGSAYAVTTNYASTNIHNLTIKIAVFSDKTNCKIENVGQTSTANLLSSTGTLTTVPSKTSVNAQFTSFSTRQFTIYAHWQNKSDLNITITNGNNSEGTQKSNPGLAGYYEIVNTGEHTRENVNYEQVFVNSTAYGNKFDINKVVNTTNEFDANANLVFNYHDDLKFDILPYFNGRYISSITMSWYGIEESSGEVADKFNFRTNFTLIKYTAKFKFSWDNKNNAIILDTIEINSSASPASKTTYGYQTTRNGDYITINSVMLGSNTYDKFSLLDNDSFKSGEYKFMKVYDNEDDKTSSYGRIDINKISMQMKDVMSSVEIECKYSIQTYEIDVYSILDTEGNNLSIKEGSNDLYNTPFTIDEFIANRDLNNAGAMNGSNDPYKSSERADNTRFATIPQDCAEYANDDTNVQFNVPYGYFIYGIFYDSAFYPHRPIDEKVSTNNVYDLLRDEYYGFEYIYSSGYYYYGQNKTESSKLTSSNNEEVNKYSAQCSPILGSRSKFEAANGIRLDGLSFYTFGGWYEYSDDGSKVIFVEYNKVKEATYLKRNITLYGYYYAINEPTSITFYVYNEDKQNYVPYTGNMNEYTLNSNTENKPFVVDDEKLVLKGNQTNFVDETGIAKINLYNRYGVNKTKFGLDDIKGSEFQSPLSFDNSAMLEKLLRTYWFYEDSYTALYYEISGVKHYIRYDETGDGSRNFYYLEDENNLNSRRTYVTIRTSDYTNFRLDFGQLLGKEELYKYNFPGSAMYIKIPKGTNGSTKDYYYELKEITDESEYEASTWLQNYKPRYYAEVYNEKYYILPRNKTDYSSSALIYNKNGASTHGSDKPISSATIVTIDFKQILFSGEYYEVEYLTGYDSSGSKYINPYYNMKNNTVSFNVDGKLQSFYYDYENNILYYADSDKKVDLVNENMRIHCSVNDNYTISATYSAGALDKWQISGIKIKSLPSPNMSFWYNDETYGFVGYIAMTDLDFDSLIKSDNADGSSGSGGEIYTAFANYIDTVYSGKSADFRLNLKTAVGDSVGAYTKEDLLSSLLVADSYELNEQKTAIEYIYVNIPVKFENLMTDTDTGEEISISLIVKYKFSIVSANTEVVKNIYAIPIYNPYIMEFKSDSVTTNEAERKVDVDIEKMDIWHFELSSTSADIYSPANGDFVKLIVLDYEQYAELKANNTNIADYMTRMRKLNKYKFILSQTLENSKLTIDMNSMTNGHYFVFAYYDKKGIDDPYINRVSDNFIHIEISDGGMVSEITDFQNITLE